jgi:hypothetical protein
MMAVAAVVAATVTSTIGGGSTRGLVALYVCVWGGGVFDFCSLGGCSHCVYVRLTGASSMDYTYIYICYIYIYVYIHTYHIYPYVHTIDDDDSSEEEEACANSPIMILTDSVLPLPL